MDSKVKKPKLSATVFPSIKYKSENITNKLASREDEVINVLRILDEATLTILCITAPFGSGKTHFVKMLKGSAEKQNINSPQKYGIIYFDAWKYDFWNDPLSAFIGELSPNVFNRQRDPEINQAFGRLENIVSILAILGTFKGIPLQLTKEVLYIIKKGVSGLSKDKSASKKSIENNRDLILTEKINQFRKELKNYIQALGFQKIYVFIDELDRCKPSFALAFLELIKHIMNDEDDPLSNVSYIFTVDKNQLSESIKHTYGDNIDAGGYLRRFFKQAYKLNQNHDFNVLCGDLLNNPKYSRLQQFSPYIVEVVNLIQLDPRSIEVFLYALNSAIEMENTLFERSETDNTGCYIQSSNSNMNFGSLWRIYIFLLAFKLSHPESYERLMNPKSQVKPPSGESRYNYYDFNQRKEILYAALKMHQDSDELRNVQCILNPYQRYPNRADPGDLSQYFKNCKKPTYDPEVWFLPLKQSIDQLEFF